MRRAVPSGRGRLLDLARGTGRPAFPLRDWFADVRSVDREHHWTAGELAGHIRSVAVPAVTVRQITS
ncbi:hypothetical protein ACICHK_01940 [Streptomyces sp. AHU1]|uniref:hypothetical protein n=1 Tax=Streptomyces sp. AHU1 TaxID=3377215 RepID=UPI0038781EF6